MIVKSVHIILFWAVLGIGLVAGVVFGGWSGKADSPPRLRINELVAANRTGLQDEAGDYVDWLELYNPARGPVNLGNYALTDNPNQPDKWPFPNRQLAGESYLVVFASGKNQRNSDGELHTNFKLKRAGEYLALYDRVEDRLWPVDSATPPAHLRDLAYGWVSDQAAEKAGADFGYFETPSPGRANPDQPTWIGRVAEVAFSVERGVYQAPLQVALTTDTPQATIYYTLDGSPPTANNGLPYQAPLKVHQTTLLRAIALKADYLPSTIETHSYIFPADVIHQPPDPVGFPTAWGVHPEKNSRYLVQKGEPVWADYELDPEIAHDPHHRDHLSAGLSTIPSLSLVTGVDDLFTLYANPQERGRDWERPVSMELIYPDGRQADVQVNAGLRIQGNIGRRSFVPKHSFRLFFRDGYGAAKFRHPLFPDSRAETFETLVLRGGVNRSYAGYRSNNDPERDYRLTTYTRDEWLRQSQRVMSGVSSHGMFVHLYLNGLYWGIYNLVERPDADFSATHYGDEPEDWFAANHRDKINGDSSRFDALHALAAQGADTLQDPVNYAQVEQRLDTTQFSDYIILNWYAGTQDWGHNNWYATLNNREGRARYFVWDAERSWVDGAGLSLGGDEEPSGHQNRIKTLFWALMWNVDFKLAFADRIYHHLFNDGALTESNVIQRWRQLNRQLEPTIVAESARWGDTRTEAPITPDDWQQAVTLVEAQMVGNVEKFIDLVRHKGLYPDIDPPTFSQHGGLVSGGDAVTLTADKGQIYYTTDGSDPRLKGSGNLPPEPIIYWTGQIAPTAHPYNAPLIFTQTTRIRARVLDNQVWSALTEATFKVVDQEAGLRISEIMYNPLGGGDYEFLELQNVGSVPVNVARLSVSGVGFTFPADASPVRPGGRLVLVRDPVAFGARYPGVPIAGVYQGQLSNRGETLSLVDAAGQTLFSISYRDAHGWPISPDGRGDSLVLINLNGNPDDPRNWRAGRSLHGSPGQPN